MSASDPVKLEDLIEVLHGLAHYLEQPERAAMWAANVECLNKVIAILNSRDELAEAVEKLVEHVGCGAEFTRGRGGIALFSTRHRTGFTAPTAGEAIKKAARAITNEEKRK